MKISVAMATYNGARYIGEQLASLAAQTRRPDELVVADDASSDGTPDIVERFAAEAPFPVRLERNARNLGFNGNFARAMERTTGDLVLISDQDDVWYPEKIAAVEAALDGAPDKLSLIHDEHLADAGGARLSGTFLERVRKVGYGDRYFVAGNCTAHRRVLLPLLLPFPAETNYDGWIATVTDLLGTRLVLERPLQMYRRHGGNSTEPELATEAPNRWAVAARFGLRDPRPGWAATIRLLDEAARRIEDRSEALDSAAGLPIASAAAARARAEKARLERRGALLSLPRPRRALAVARLWLGGFYRDFEGVKSAAKDALRP